MRYRILRYSALSGVMLLFIAAASLLGQSTALANDGGFDPNIQRAVRNAGVFAVSPCNGESVQSAGLTTTVYDIDWGRRGLELQVKASYTGTGVGDRGNTYRMTIEADRDFRKPTVGDAFNGYFDLGYSGDVTGPDRLSYKVRGTWRVFIVDGQPLNDAVLSLQGDCSRDRHDDRRDDRHDDRRDRNDKNDRNDQHDGRGDF
jgi:hypothetical protein